MKEALVQQHLAVERAEREILNRAAQLVGAYETYKQIRRCVDKPIHERLVNLRQALDEYMQTCSTVRQTEKGVTV